MNPYSGIIVAAGIIGLLCGCMIGEYRGFTRGVKRTLFDIRDKARIGRPRIIGGWEYTVREVKPGDQAGT